MSYENVGDSTVKIQAMANVKLVTGLKNLTDADLKAIEEDVYQKMKSHEYLLPGAATFAITPHDAKFVTFPTPPLNQKVINSIESEDAVFLTVGIMAYVEPKDHKDVEFCVLWGTPNGKIMDCPIHNEE